MPLRSFFDFAAEMQLHAAVFKPAQRDEILHGMYDSAAWKHDLDQKFENVNRAALEVPFGFTDRPYYIQIDPHLSEQKLVGRLSDYLAKYRTGKDAPPPVNKLITAALHAALGETSEVGKIKAIRMRLKSPVPPNEIVKAYLSNFSMENL